MGSCALSQALPVAVRAGIEYDDFDTPGCWRRLVLGTSQLRIRSKLLRVQWSNGSTPARGLPAISIPRPLLTKRCEILTLGEPQDGASNSL